MTSSRGPYRSLPPHPSARRGRHGRGVRSVGRTAGAHVAIKRVSPIPPARARSAPPRAPAPGGPGRRRLSHPAVVQIYDVVETDEADWIVLERVDGPTLAELRRQGPLPLARLLPLAREIAEGLAEAHDRGILHRDLKSENIVVTRSGHAKILDFGLAKRFWPAGSGAGGDLSRDGEIAGTPRAMSPNRPTARCSIRARTSSRSARSSTRRSPASRPSKRRRRWRRCTASARTSRRRRRSSTRPCHCPSPS